MELYFKIKNNYPSKTMIESTQWKISVSLVVELILVIYKEHLQITKKEIGNPIEKSAKELNRHVHVCQ